MNPTTPVPPVPPAPPGGAELVPVIDVAPLGGGPGEGAGVAARMAVACERSGMFLATGHGIAPALRDELLAVTRAFFAGTPAQRLAVAASPDRRAGYRPPGTVALARTAGGETPPDLVETFVVEVREGGRANRWPSRPARFAPVWSAYLAEVERLGRRLVRAAAVALDLPERWFDRRFTGADPLAAMMANHYPPCTQPPAEGQLRRGAHTDFGALTVLGHDDPDSGLEIWDADLGWVPVPVVAGALVVNVGDLFARWSGDRWRSPLHRVANPPGGTADRPRLSVAYFHDPDGGALVAPVPTCRRDDDAGAPVTAAAWRAAKIRQAHGGGAPPPVRPPARTGRAPGRPR